MEREEIFAFLQGARDGQLFTIADQVRRQHCGDTVHIRGIIEFSNHCCRDCYYCGLRKSNTQASRYRMSQEEILETVDAIAADGIGTVVLQSGDDFAYRQDDICMLIRSIKTRYPEMAVTLSIGERPQEDYRAFRECGADRYLLKHETADAQLFESLHPSQKLADRLERLQFLRSLGYQVGAGNIVGLKGQTPEHLVEDVLLFQEFQPDMLSVGPFIPQKDTPLHDQQSPSLDLVMRCIALARIVTKNAHIPSATAVNTLDPETGHLQAIQSGANVLMMNYTPDPYREKYAIYNGKQSVVLQQAIGLCHQISRIPSLSRGDSLKLG